jgi:hypothetical protein
LFLRSIFTHIYDHKSNKDVIVLRGLQPIHCYDFGSANQQPGNYVILAIIFWAEKCVNRKSETTEMKIRSRGRVGFSPFPRKRSGSGEMGTGKSDPKEAKINNGARRTVGVFENEKKNVRKIVPE